MDVASSEFLMPDGRYDLDFKNKGGDQQLTGEELGQLYKDLSAKYPIVSIEDPFDQDDWANYAPFTAAVGESVQVVGDDLLVTNPSRILEAGEKKACNALLLKVCLRGRLWLLKLLGCFQGWGLESVHQIYSFFVVACCAPQVSSVRGEGVPGTGFGPACKRGTSCFFLEGASRGVKCCFSLCSKNVKVVEMCAAQERTCCVVIHLSTVVLAISSCPHRSSCLAQRSLLVILKLDEQSLAERGHVLRWAFLFRAGYRRTPFHVELLRQTADRHFPPAVLLQVNQIGSVTESIKAVKMSKQLGWGVMTSHRSGETEDNYIADIAVGLCTGQIKTGAPCRSERLAKYNQARECLCDRT